MQCASGGIASEKTQPPSNDKTPRAAKHQGVLPRKSLTLTIAPSDAETLNPFGDTLTRQDLFDIESSTDFWNRTPQLQLIWHTARRYNRMSPWGLLAAVMTHRVSHIPPNVVLVEDDGSEGSTLVDGMSANIFTALCGRPGSGKSRAIRKATSLVPPCGIPLPDGTGQGIVRQFSERVKITKDGEGKPLDVPYMTTRFMRHSLTLHAPEVKTLNAEFAREGSKTAEMLRSMWVGETVGMTNSDKDRTGVLLANMYRIAALWGVQPKNASAIMAGAGDGTPQRFLWAPVEEFRTRDDEHPFVATPSPVTTFPFPVFLTGPADILMQALPKELVDGEPLPDPIWVHWSPQMKADIDAFYEQQKVDDADREEWESPDDDAAQAIDETREMETHLLLMRIKVAVQIGFLHGHTEPSDLDWFLSGVLMEVSIGTAAGVWQVCQREEQKEAAKRGTTRGIEMDAATTAAAAAKFARVSGVADDAYKKLAALGPLRENGVKMKLTAGKRPFVRDALRYLEDNGKAEYDGTLWHAVYNGRKLGRD